MRAYFRTLPSQPVAVRRRFVALATTGSFLLILLVWVGVRALGRSRTPPPTASPAPAGAEAAPTPVASPLVNVEDLSVNLLRAFGSPGPRR